MAVAFFGNNMLNRVVQWIDMNTIERFIILRILK